jgi:hypothetical protein
MNPNRTRGTTTLRLCLIAVWFLVSAAAHAATISNLFNTGVNGAGVALGPNVIDPHYVITASPSGPSPARTVIDTAFPFPPWVANSPGVGGSRWIGPEANGNGPAGNYRYRTTFTVPANANLSTVNVSGLWGTDDPSIAMRINGNLTPNVSGGFTSLVPFSITSGFVLGNNVLTFDLANVISVTGLRVDKAVGTYQIIPEPSSLCIAGTLLFASVVVQRRRRRSVIRHTRRDVMIRHRQFATVSMLVGFISFASYLATTATADPLTGRDLLKFQQLPMINTTVLNPNGVPGTYQGHDELSTAYGFPNAANVIPFYQGRFMADDFADSLSSPVVHVKWWGSYAHDIINPQMPVDKFLISFESDVPATSATGFSHPGQPLLNQVVKRAPLAPGSGTFTEKLIRGPDPILGESLYEYNAELHLGKDFPEKQDTVYWLKIAAMVDVPAGLTFPPNQPPTFATQWGWHNRDYTVQDLLASPLVVPGENQQGPLNGTPVWHFQDDAVTGAVRIDPNGPGGLLMPNVFQPVANMSPTRYLDGIDGPAGGAVGALGIGAFSKDLAFELYTVVPEPATCLLMSVGLAGVLSLRRRSTRA